MKTKRVALLSEDISAVGFGCWAVGGGDIWNRTTDQDSTRAIHRSVDLGETLFDVAPVYGLGHAEEILGTALFGRRHQVLIASKCGLVWDGLDRMALNATAESLDQHIDQSLACLKTDYVDIYQIQRMKSCHFARSKRNLGSDGRKCWRALKTPWRRIRRQT